MTGQQGESSQQTMLETDHPTSSSNIDTKEISYAKKLHNEKTNDTIPTLDSCCPVTTPLHRRLQTTIIAWHCSSFVIFTLFNLFLLSSPICWLLVIPYLIYFFNDRSPANGNVVNRYSIWFRSLYIWDLYCEYFPITLIRSSELKPTFTLEPRDKTSSYNGNLWKIRLWPTYYHLHIKKRFQNNSKFELKPTGPRYIFGYHPHGIGALGAFGAFGTEGCRWSQKFPGIPMSLMTLVTQFHIPLYRDYLLALGITSVSRKNALKVLQNNQSICIVVGGARESLLTEPNTVELILNKRKGFVKLALETGNVGLVPTFVFGENNTYQIFRSRENSWLRNAQLWVKANFGFTIPIFYARGLFNYDFGLLPFRTPLAVITGKPINIKERTNNPPENIVNHYHELYIEELRRIYYENRDQHGMSDVEFKIVG